MKYPMIHTCIRVKDLQASEQFYQKAFGFEISRKKDFPDSGFTLSYLRSPGEAFELELTYNYDREDPYALGDGYSHLAVSVETQEFLHNAQCGLSAIGCRCDNEIGAAVAVSARKYLRVGCSAACRVNQDFTPVSQFNA